MFLHIIIVDTTVTSWTSLFDSSHLLHHCFVTNNVLLNFVYTWFLYCFQNVTSGLQCPSALAWPIAHAAAFTVNVALVVSQWTHCAWNILLHSPINVKHKAGQATSSIFQLFSVSTWNQTHPTSFGGAYTSTVPLSQLKAIDLCKQPHLFKYNVQNWQQKH